MKFLCQCWWKHLATVYVIRYKALQHQKRSESLQTRYGKSALMNEDRKLSNFIIIKYESKMNTVDHVANLEPQGSLLNGSDLFSESDGAELWASREGLTRSRLELKNFTSYNMQSNELEERTNPLLIDKMQAMLEEAGAEKRKQTIVEAVVEVSYCLELYSNCIFEYVNSTRINVREGTRDRKYSVVWKQSHCSQIQDEVER